MKCEEWKWSFSLSVFIYQKAKTILFQREHDYRPNVADNKCKVPSTNSAWTPCVLTNFSPIVQMRKALRFRTVWQGICKRGFRISAIQILHTQQLIRCKEFFYHKVIAIFKLHLLLPMSCLAGLNQHLDSNSPNPLPNKGNLFLSCGFSNKIYQAIFLVWSCSFLLFGIQFAICNVGITWGRMATRIHGGWYEAAKWHKNVKLFGSMELFGSVTLDWL